MLVRSRLRLLCLAIACLSLASCRKLSSSLGEPLRIEPIKSTTSISREYGNLVSVTSTTPNLALLWFERPDKTIVVVGVNMGGGTAALAGDVAVIPRN